MSKPSKPDHKFRLLPTPEQIRAHGEGGLWESDDEADSHYKFWDRDRSTPWYDCSSPGGEGFCEDGHPRDPSAKRTPAPTLFRPLNPDGMPRDWAEIDAIVAGAKAPTTEPEFRRPTDEEIRAHKANGGVWERPTSSMTKFRWMGFVGNDLKAWNSDEPMPNRNGGWLVSEVDPEGIMRPVDKQGKPIAWESLAAKPAQPAQPAHADTEWRLLPDTETLKTHPWWVANDSDDYSYMCTSSDGLYDIGGEVRDLTEMKPRLSIDTHRSNAGYLLCLYKQWRPCDSAGTPIAWSAIAQPLPRIWSPQGACKITKLEYSDRMEPGVVTVDGRVLGTTLGTYTANVSAFEGDLSQLPPVFDLIVEAPGANPPQIDILVGCRRHGNTLAYIDYIIHNGKTLCSVPRMPVETPTFQRVSGSVLDCFAAAWYNTTRKPNETDEQLRQRCRDLWTAQEKPVMSQYTPLSTTPALPDFAKMSPEDRARYRAALDAVDPPTTRDAIRSGLEHAPVEIALDKLHNFVAKLANLWTEGSDEDRQTAARFLRDMVGSDYGKAAIGLAAGAALPHAAPLANKLLPDDKDAAPLLRRIGYILAERGAATGAKQLGLDIMDATGPIIAELRSLLGELLSGMRKAETVAGLLPPASSRLSFDGALTVESAETKR